MRDTRNSQICIAESDRAGRPPAAQNGGSAGIIPDLLRRSA